MILNNKPLKWEKQKIWETKICKNKMAAGIFKSEMDMGCWRQFQDKSQGLWLQVWSYIM